MQPCLPPRLTKLTCNDVNRCARNCFLCPSCDHTLSIVASDPSPSSVTDLRSAPASVGEPPYFLACSFCRWDSKQVGITFEKPTGLTLQLQKQEEESPDRLEFDRLRDHFEPFLKAQLAALQHQSLQGAPTTTSHHNTSSARQNAASAALLKDIPSLAASSRYTSVLASTSLSRLATGRSHSHTHLSAAAESKEDLADYRSLVGSKDLKGKGKSREDERVEFLREGISTGGLDASATLDKRWTDVWDPPSRSSDLRPLRVPLRSKQTKRCPSCTHILIRPEQKAQSTRFKIKLMANMFLPAIEMSRRTALSNLPSRLTAAATAAGRRGGARASMAGPGGTAGPGGAAAGKEKEEEALRQGRTYTFELSFVNPLYEPITVRLALPAPPTSSGDDTTPPFTISLPASSFSIAAFAEVWEYDDEDEDDAVDDGQGAGGGDAKRSRLSVGGSSLSSKRRDAPGVLERKANRTTVAVEVAIGKDFLGPLKVRLPSIVRRRAMTEPLRRLHRPTCWSPTRTNPTTRRTNRGRRRPRPGRQMGKSRSRSGRR